MISPALAPLKSSVSLPPWPSTMSLASPGFQTKRVRAASELDGVVPVAAGDEVVAVAADERVVADTADERVVAALAVIVSASSGKRRRAG